MNIKLHFLNLSYCDGYDSVLQYKQTIDVRNIFEKLRHKNDHYSNTFKKDSVSDFSFTQKKLNKRIF